MYLSLTLSAEISLIGMATSMSFFAFISTTARQTSDKPEIPPNRLKLFCYCFLAQIYATPVHGICTNKYKFKKISIRRDKKRRNKA